MSRERIMLTQAIPAVQQLRRVQGFDPLRFLKRNASGGIELEPRYQRLWFRLACPDGKMLLNRLQITDQIAVYEAQVFLSREDNQPITNFTAAVEKAQAPAGRYVQAAQDEALKTALDNAGFGIQLCEITPSAAVDAQADGKQEVATGTVNRQETAPAANRATAPQREDAIGESHPVQAAPTLQEAQPQEAAKTPSVNQQVVPPAQQAESVSDAMSLLQALSGGAEASEPDPVMPQKAQEISSETAEPAVIVHEGGAVHLQHPVTEKCLITGQRLTKVLRHGDALSGVDREKLHLDRRGIRVAFHLNAVGVAFIGAG